MKDKNRTVEILKNKDVARFVKWTKVDSVLRDEGNWAVGVVREDAALIELWDGSMVTLLIHEFRFVINDDR